LPHGADAVVEIGVGVLAVQTIEAACRGQARRGQRQQQAQAEDQWRARPFARVDGGAGRACRARRAGRQPRAGRLAHAAVRSAFGRPVRRIAFTPRPAGPSVVYAAALLLAIVLPFEAIPPVITVGTISLTVEKLVLLIVLGAWVLQGWQALPSQREWRVLLPSLVLLLVTLTSARVADS